jgi:hypothetical protein
LFDLSKKDEWNVWETYYGYWLALLPLLFWR